MQGTQKQVAVCRPSLLPEVPCQALSGSEFKLKLVLDPQPKKQINRNIFMLHAAYQSERTENADIHLRHQAQGSKSR